MTDKEKVLDEINSHCNTCRGELIERPDMFFLPETGPLPGLYCEKCNYLYSSKEFIEAVKNRVQKNSFEEWRIKMNEDGKSVKITTILGDPYYGNGLTIGVSIEELYLLAETMRENIALSYDSEEKDKDKQYKPSVQFCNLYEKLKNKIYSATGNKFFD